LGEKIAHELILQGRLFENVTDIKREVSRIADMDMRADFVLTEPDGTKRVVEVKTVVDTDYSTHHGLPDRTKCVFTSDTLPYKRTALFPWGQSNQKGPDGEKVVSARAIKHVRELTKLANMEGYRSTVLFIVIRGDAEAFRPNYEACPSFCKYLKEAEDSGVQILAKRVTWTVTDDQTATCLDDKTLDIEWPAELHQNQN
jgi:DNA-binding sugar fermentation-stimulating protein